MSEKSFWPTWPENKIFTILVALVLLAILGLAGVVIRNGLKEYNYIGRVGEQRDTISISGEGKVIAIPDIATVQLGLVTEKKTVAAAQKENTETMNQLIKKLKEQGIESKDIQTTNYSIYPQYDWITNRQVLRGYQVNQTVTVKIRDLDKVSDVLDTVGTLGLNQVGGLDFNIDEPEKLRQEARIKALENAKEKARALTKAMGVNLGKIVSFSESSQSQMPTPRLIESHALKEGVGGAGPEIEKGSMEIVINATVVYEIK
ncbi:MAG: SIMPL domain-containing protein [Patescibacteria group bacterium]